MVTLSYLLFFFRKITFKARSEPMVPTYHQNGFTSIKSIHSLFEILSKNLNINRIVFPKYPFKMRVSLYALPYELALSPLIWESVKTDPYAKGKTMEQLFPAAFFRFCMFSMTSQRVSATFSTFTYEDKHKITSENV